MIALEQTNIAQVELDVQPIENRYEALLIARLREHDLAAFEELVSHFERPVYAICFRLLGDAEDAAGALHGLRDGAARGMDPSACGKIPTEHDAAPNQLDLGALAQKQAMPGDLALTLQVYSTSFVEAGMPQIPTDSTKNLQNIIDEKINMSFACVKTANDAIQKYNTSRGKVPGEVVGTLAQKANIREFPRELPYFVVPPSAPPVPPVPRSISATLKP